VELYDEWGNRGTPRAEQPTSSTNANAEQSAHADAEPNTSTSADASRGDLSETLEKLNLGCTNQTNENEENQGNEISAAGDTATTTDPTADDISGASSGIDIESESGWTLLEHDRVRLPQLCHFIHLSLRLSFKDILLNCRLKFHVMLKHPELKLKREQKQVMRIKELGLRFQWLLILL
jgi:hypothetical protein